MYACDKYMRLTYASVACGCCLGLRRYAYIFADSHGLSLRDGCGWVDRFVCWLGVERTWLAEHVRNRVQGIDGGMNLVQVGLMCEQ